MMFCEAQTIQFPVAEYNAQPLLSLNELDPIAETRKTRVFLHPNDPAHVLKIPTSALHREQEWTEEECRAYLAREQQKTEAAKRYTPLTIVAPPEEGILAHTATGRVVPIRKQLFIEGTLFADEPNRLHTLTNESITGLLHLLWDNMRCFWETHQLLDIHGSLPLTRRPEYTPIHFHTKPFDFSTNFIATPDGSCVWIDQKTTTAPPKAMLYTLIKLSTFGTLSLLGAYGKRE